MNPSDLKSGGRITEGQAGAFIAAALAATECARCGKQLAWPVAWQEWLCIRQWRLNVSKVWGWLQHRILCGPGPVLPAVKKAAQLPRFPKRMTVARAKAVRERAERIGKLVVAALEKEAKGCSTERNPK